MTRLFNNPDDFASEMVRGFAAASSRWVQPVTGGVIRSSRGAEPTVAIVVGGGSGHYPAFGGLVGPGLAHGAAMGNLFASPSAHRVHSVASHAHEGRGVLLSYGNYAGDVLHFDEAQERLRADGVDCRTVRVTDDIWSAPIDQIEKRRGIAGDLTVFNWAGAAAEAGYGIDDVERVARHANDRTRSFGVAFGGCTFPGAHEPLFSVPAGKMAVGLGIHGEPGIEITDMPSADELARVFVAKLLDEVPAGIEAVGARVVPILNGLGSVKHEELFVVYASVQRELEAAGLVVVAPEVGEFCTSFEMAGASLTLFWLDEELERLWLAPCDSPGFRRGSVPDRLAYAAAPDSGSLTLASATVPSSSAESRVAAERLQNALDAVAELLDTHADELGRLDRIAGDGDHGIGMQRGSAGAATTGRALIAIGVGAQTLLQRAGDAWSDEGGGTSGAIWGRMLYAFGSELGDDRALHRGDIARGITAMRSAIMSFGKAMPGDKTMIDAVVPFADEFERRVAAGDPLVTAWKAAADAAQAGADLTATMIANLGRARAHGEKSLGTPDPGAVSFAWAVRTVLDTLTDKE